MVVKTQLVNEVQEIIPPVKIRKHSQLFPKAVGIEEAIFNINATRIYIKYRLIKTRTVTNKVSQPRASSWCSKKEQNFQFGGFSTAREQYSEKRFRNRTPNYIYDQKIW